MNLDKIIYLKKKKNYTNEEMAIKSGIPKGTLDKILCGTTKDPKFETVKAIARVLDCTLIDLDDVDASKDQNVFDFNELQVFIENNVDELTMAQKMTLIKILSNKIN